jgi:hypothetical protein
MERTDKEIAEPNAVTDQSDIDRGGVSGRVRDVAASLKRQASTLPAVLADGLEAGAEALRQQRARPSGGKAGTAVVVGRESAVTELTDTLADGMKSSADWIRDADLDKLKDGVEKQVKKHPARSLLVALGAGYLLGKVFRR